MKLDDIADLHELSREIAEKIMEYLHPDHDEEEVDAVAEVIQQSLAEAGVQIKP